MYRLFLVLVSIGAAIASPSTPVLKCKGVTQDLFKRVVVSTPKGVCTKLPCEIVSGAEVKADITFPVRSEVEKITLKCNATTLGITVPYPVPNADKGCDLLTNTYCPIEAGTEADLTFKMKIAKSIPKVAVDLTFYLLDQKERMISCFLVRAKTVSGKRMLSTDATKSAINNTDMILY